MKTIFYVFLALLIFSTCTGEGQSSGAFILSEERGSVILRDKKTLSTRAVMDFSLLRRITPEATFYDLRREGSGQWDKYEDISWVHEARMKEDGEVLLVLSSLFALKEKTGKILMTYEKIFDHQNKLIQWTARDGDRNIIKANTFPIKGRTADDVTLFFFLKPYIARRSQAEFKDFYLLTNEPRLYRCVIRDMGTEMLQLPGGRKEAVKLKLTGDMGIIDAILDKFVPHTYVWYETESPYQWLQYEGLETGASSANILISLENTFYDAGLNRTPSP